MSTYIKLFLDTRHLNSKNGYPIKFKITHNRIPTTLKTGYSVEKKYWDEKYLRVKRGSKLIPNHVDFNSMLKRLDSNYTEILINIQKTGILSSLSIQELKSILTNKAQNNSTTKNTSFISFTRLLIEDLIKEERIGTAKSYELAIGFFNKYNGGDVFFEQITPKLLEKLEKRYMNVPNNHYNGLSVYLRATRAIFNKAIAAGIVDTKYYPFRRGSHETNKFQIKHEKTKKRAVSKEIIKQIEQFDNGNQLIIKHKYYFLFSFYTLGMNMVDMAKLKKSNINNGILKYKRQKTGKTYEFRLNNKALDILEYFGFSHKKSNDYLFPIISKNTKTSIEEYNQLKNNLKQTNKVLKYISTEIGLDVKITTYVSRHSWATIADKAGIDRRTISQALGHSDLNTTNIYIDDIVGSNDISDANDLIVG